jgi:hypothetical protein
VLVLLGAISAFVAMNVAVGGLETLGWQGSTKYFQVTDHDVYLLRDSHARFYGCVYLALAGFLIVAATNLHRHRNGLYMVCAAIFAGGLARLTQMELGVTFGSDLTVSSVIELAGMPALALAIARTTRTPRTPRRQRSTDQPSAPTSELTPKEHFDDHHTADPRRNRNRPTGRPDLDRRHRLHH